VEPDAYYQELFGAGGFEIVDKYAMEAKELGLEH
jgi:hypothetical protein